MRSRQAIPTLSLPLNQPRKLMEKSLRKSRELPNQLWQKTGTSLGRLIYWDDAWTDWIKDRKHGRFNPSEPNPGPRTSGNDGRRVRHPFRIHF